MTSEASAPRPEPALGLPRVIERRDAAADALRRCARGEAEALAELYALASRAVFARVRGIVPSNEAAEEVLQEVFLYAWRSADRYDPAMSSPATWLSQIARSRAIDHMRKGGKWLRAKKAFAIEATGNTEATGPRSTLQVERRARLLQALLELPGSQREPVMLAHFQDLTQAEISERLQIPLGTVKSRTKSAYQALRDRLGAEADELL